MDILAWASSNPAILVSFSALGFTLYSFWWMNWRKGKLHIGEPRSYAAHGSMDDLLILQIPFVFFNTGPTPIIVQNLRIIFTEESSPEPLIFSATVGKLASDAGRALSTQIPIRGREAPLIICEFQRRPGNLLFESRSYPIELQAKLDDSKKWKCVCRFSLNVNKMALHTINRLLAGHDNMSEP
jgi:hypothetical protein